VASSAEERPRQQTAGEQATEDGEDAQQDTHHPERDPADDAHEPADGGVADDGARSECERGRGRTDGREPRIQQHENGRTQRGRNGEQEGEPEGDLLLEATQEERRDGGARP